MNKQQIIDILENFAPLDLQEDWDNSGWQIKSKEQNIEKIMLCVSPTIDVLEQAIQKNIDLIISHHPLIFPSVSVIDNEFIHRAIKNDIQLYSMHTNFDKAQEGTSGYLANELGFDNLSKLDEYVQIAELKEALPMDDVILKIKSVFNLKTVKTISYSKDKLIKKAAFCAGAGGSFLEKINHIDVDLYITSDVKYHNELKNTKCTVVEIDHMLSERPALKKIEQLLIHKDIEVLTANEESNTLYI